MTFWQTQARELKWVPWCLSFSLFLVLFSLLDFSIRFCVWIPCFLWRFLLPPVQIKGREPSIFLAPFRGTGARVWGRKGDCGGVGCCSPRSIVKGDQESTLIPCLTFFSSHRLPRLQEEAFVPLSMHPPVPTALLLAIVTTFVIWLMTRVFALETSGWYLFLPLFAWRVFFLHWKHHLWELLHEPSPASRPCSDICLYRSLSWFASCLIWTPLCLYFSCHRLYVCLGMHVEARGWCFSISLYFILWLYMHICVMST